MNVLWLGSSDDPVEDLDTGRLSSIELPDANLAVGSARRLQSSAFSCRPNSPPSTGSQVETRQGTT